MEKSVRRSPIIKWQLIVGMIVCAFIAFCTLPSGMVEASAAETKTVEYIDKYVNYGGVNQTYAEVISKPSSAECTVLTAELLDKGLTDGWYVVDGELNYDEEVQISGDVKIILCDGCELKIDDTLYIKEDSKLSVYGQSEGEKKGKLSVYGAKNQAGISIY